MRRIRHYEKHLRLTEIADVNQRIFIPFSFIKQFFGGSEPSPYGIFCEMLAGQRLTPAIIFAFAEKTGWVSLQPFTMGFAFVRQPQFFFLVAILEGI